MIRRTSGAGIGALGTIRWLRGWVAGDETTLSRRPQPSPTFMSSLTDDDRERRYTPSPIARPRSHSTHSTLSSISESQPHSPFRLRLPPILSLDYANSTTNKPMSTPPLTGVHARECSAPLPSSAANPGHTHRVSLSQPHIGATSGFEGYSFARALTQGPLMAEQHDSEHDDSMETGSTAHTNASSNSSIEIISCHDTTRDEQDKAELTNPGEGANFLLPSRIYAIH